MVSVIAVLSDFCRCMIERYVANVNSMTFKELPANTIASIVCEEGDANGFLLLLMNKILDHKSSGEAIKIYNDTAGQLA